VTQLAAHEKIFVGIEFIEQDKNHGSISCEVCHGGDPKDSNWKTAHSGVIKDPSYTNAEKNCGRCHEEAGKNYKESLHYTLSPYYSTMRKRANKDAPIYEKIMASTEKYCGRCHSSCGQCHVSRPDSVEGGLLDAHVFHKKPPNDTTCTACHGTRIGDEYYGKNEGLKPDIHYEKLIKCENCHTGKEMHGDGKEHANRYDVENGPKCIDCHSEIYGETAENSKNHLLHKDKVSCYVCHSQEYKNCYSCHVKEDTDEKQYFKSKPSKMGFKIGLNPDMSEKRPEQFVTLRHIPIDKGLFDFYIKDGLTEIDSIPTWKVTTPHNIRRKTKQNSRCNNCHGVKSIYLLTGDVAKNERAANMSVVVPKILMPAKVIKH
jgi:hypothetical protein